MAEPFLKWAGGKRWLVNSASLPLPSNYNRYIEPFLGGGAVFFHLRSPQAVLGDINSDLIELYLAVRDDPGGLKQALQLHQELHCAEHYYRVRSHVPPDPLDRAARTLYLNRTCWNGLYRVNKKGQFNVPIGTKYTVLFDNEDFLRASSCLQNADIAVRDFEITISYSGLGDFIFVDPPYTVKHNMNGFVKYNEKIFTWADQVRLHRSLVAAAERGAFIVVTNADHESVRDLYREGFSYKSLTRNSVLAGQASLRGVTSEALFTANL